VAFDPIATDTVRIAPSREPVFSHPEQAAAAKRKLAELERRTGRKPNILIVLMDDVGWGDFGCYGGGVIAGAPTPLIRKLVYIEMIQTALARHRATLRDFPNKPPSVRPNT
jgi:arylsulfatase